MNGCPKFLKLRTSCLSILLLSLTLLLPNVSLAQEDSAQTLPSTELLDFLGSFDDEENGWIDPFELLEMDDAELSPTEEQENENVE